MEGVKVMMKWVVLVLVLAGQSMSAVEGQCPYETVKEALVKNDLPGGLFPDNVETFSCAPLLESNSYRITLRLQSAGCRVTREALGVENTVVFQQDVSAAISNRQLIDIKGVSVELSASLPPFLPLDITLTINEVRVTQILGITLLQFHSVEGVSSPPFQFSDFPSDPPSCNAASTVNINPNKMDNVRPAPRLPRLISLFQ